jgi:hypothetical protein
MLMNSKLEGIWDVNVYAQFKLLSHLPGVTKKISRIP